MTTARIRGHRRRPRRPAAAAVPRLLTGLFAAGLAVAACSPRLEPATPPDRPHVLLISLDTLRADRLGSYGHTRDTSPFLDSLADGGTRFARSFVNTHGTPPSHATLFTSLYQESHRVSHGILDGQVDHRMPDELPTLPQVLLDAGYHTVAVTGGGFMSADFGWRRGFERFYEEEHADGVDKLFRAIRSRDDGTPIFAFFHTYEIHSPYDPAAPYRTLWGELDAEVDATSEGLKARSRRRPFHLSDPERESLLKLYDAGIRYTDDTLRELFGRLDAIGFLDHALVIVTSDHGEEFGEHGSLLHPATLYEELVSVPLIISGPGVDVGKVDDRLVSTIDIAPTIYGYLDVRAPRWTGGADLLEPYAPGRGEVFLQYGDLLYGVRTPNFKLIENEKTGNVKLFDLQRDPAEQRNIARTRPFVVETLTARLEQWRSSVPRFAARSDEAPALSDERLDELRALGYVD
ncbi:MAG: sulfatase [Acidobacteriota bacterium]